MPNKAQTRLTVNRLLEQAGWRFVPDADSRAPNLLCEPRICRRQFARQDDPSNAALQRLAAARTDLLDCCGAYACGTPAIDLMVDLARAVPGVVGAQLAGAGLGGCMMVLVRPDALPAAQQVLRQSYYQPRDLPPEMHVCSPVEGAGLLGVPVA